MRLTFLGTGTSFGVPQIGCDCAVCRSADPRDRRSRSGALLEVGGSMILIDTPPELRLQMLGAGLSRVDAVLYTHEHADHVNGIDDLRIFSVRQRRPIPCHGPAETLERVRGAGFRPKKLPGFRCGSMLPGSCRAIVTMPGGPGRESPPKCSWPCMPVPWAM